MPRLACRTRFVFVPIDFERETLADVLQSAGFNGAQRSFFSWLGVVPYLTEPVIFSTLRFIAQLAGGAEVTFDMLDPAASVAPAGRAAHQALAERVAAMGERIQSYFDTAPLCAQMSAAGFRRVDDIGPARDRDEVFSGGGTVGTCAWRARHARLNDLSPAMPRAVELRRQYFSSLPHAASVSSG